MKKFCVLFVICFAFCISAKEVALVKKVEATKEVATITKPLTQNDWFSNQDKAKALCLAKDYIGSAKVYMEGITIAEMVKDGFTEVRTAWDLNDAANMIIEQYKLDNKTDLIVAKAYLEKAQTIKEIDSECAKFVKSNLDFIAEHMKVEKIK